MNIQLIVDGTINKVLTNHFLGLLELDLDPLAERILLIDRSTLKPIYANIRGSLPILKIILPLKYTIGNNILICVLDDDRIFDSEFIDGVNAVITDGNTVNN